MDDDDIGDFVADTIARQNNRIYGANVAPELDALDYLDKDTYSDDEWDVEIEAVEIKSEPTSAASTTATSTSATTDRADSGDAKGSFIELSDSEDEDEEEDETEQPTATTAATAAATAVTTPAAPVLSALEIAAQQRALQIARMKAAAEEKERAELEQRRLKFEAAQNAPRSSRSALLTSLRQKVHLTAKENYCNQRKVRINSEELTLRLQIADKCRLLVELLKERHLSRENFKTEVRRAKYVQQVMH